MLSDVDVKKVEISSMQHFSIVYYETVINVSVTGLYSEINVDYRIWFPHFFVLT